MTKLLWQTEAGKRWRLDDGREVEVFNDHDRCQKCGRPLKNEFSRMVGRGHGCRAKSGTKVMIVALVKHDPR